MERWLLQLEELMIQSLKTITLMCINAYFSAKRRDWVISWVGQVVQAANCIHFTTEVIIYTYILLLFYPPNIHKCIMTFQRGVEIVIIILLLVIIVLYNYELSGHHFLDSHF